MNIKLASIHIALLALAIVPARGSESEPLPPPPPSQDLLYRAMQSRILHPMFPLEVTGDRLYFRRWTEPEFRIYVDLTPPNIYAVDAVAMKRNLEYAVEDLWNAGVRDADEAWKKLPMQHAETDTQRCPELLPAIKNYRTLLLQSAQKYEAMAPSQAEERNSAGSEYEYEASIANTTAALSLTVVDRKHPVVQAAMQLAAVVSKCTKTPLKMFESNEPVRIY